MKAKETAILALVMSASGYLILGVLLLCSVLDDASAAAKAAVVLWWLVSLLTEAGFREALFLCLVAAAICLGVEAQGRIR